MRMPPTSSCSIFLSINFSLAGRRHSSSAVLKYVEDAQAFTLNMVPMEAAARRDLDGLRFEIQLLRVQVQAAHAAAPAPPEPAPATPVEPVAVHRRFVLGTRGNGRIRIIRRSAPGFTRCGWHFSACAAATELDTPFPNDPALAAPLCARCRAIASPTASPGDVPTSSESSDA